MAPCILGEWSCQLDSTCIMVCKALIVKNIWMHEVSYLRRDAQAEELCLMEKHLEVFMQRVEWE